jgi:hypothetical protein
MTSRNRVPAPESAPRASLPVDLVGGRWRGRIGRELRHRIFSAEVG